VLALDLPGHGESDPLPGNPQDLATWLRAVCHVLDQLGISQVHVWGHQGGAALACALAVQQAKRVRSVVLDAPLWVDDALRERMLSHGIPDVLPSAEGAHWLRAWHHLRDAELWWPWFERRHAHKKPQPSNIEPERLNARVLEAMKQPESYAGAWRANWACDWAGQLPHVQAPLLCLSSERDTYAHLSLMPRAGMPAAQTCPPEHHAERLCQWWRSQPI
jgi:pimeloyl-ACP methyl ester carboxylesterase